MPVDDIAEAIQFLEWLLADNFTLLGVRDYSFTEQDGLVPARDSGLGMLRGQDVPVLSAAARWSRSRRSFAPSSRSRRR